MSVSRSMPGVSRATGGGGGSSPPQRPAQQAKPNRRGVHLTSLILLLVIQIVMYELFPHFTQWLEFDIFLRKVWYLGPWASLGLLSWQYVKNQKLIQLLQDKTGVPLGSHRRPIAVVATLAIVFLIWDVFIFAGTDLLTYHTYASDFKVREGLIPSAPAFVRFTPLRNACTDIGNSVSETGQHIDCSYVQPMITDHGFGYAAPITPSGIYNTFFTKNPGFLVLDDSLKADEDPGKRLVRIDETQDIGQGMEWFDNLNYQLAKTDFFADFDTPHFLSLDPQQPQKLTLIVPKVKYGFLFRLPYWGGDVLVNSDGKIEDLTAEQAQKDPRLAGKWIYPMSLARQYVHLQNYAAGHGLLTPVARLSGLFEIEDLTGDNQFPFLSQGSDGKPYLVTATKGQGTAQGLFRMYFTDASTGVGTYHEFNSHEVVYGAGASLKRVFNVPGYQWNNGAGTSGVAVAIEPVYIVRPNDPVLYWKYTITNVNHTGISATAVVNASRPDDIRVFTKRVEFEEWMEGVDTSTPAAASSGGSHKDQVLRMISDLARQLDALRQEVQTLH
jgi:hypothetical protein